VNLDRSEIADEYKCTVDDIVISGQLKEQKCVMIQNIQIFGLLAEKCSFKFVDRGLHVSMMEFDLSLGTSFQSFGKDLLVWVLRLVQFKRKCLSLVSILNEAFQRDFFSLSQR
jgi:hypothetical protein